MNTLIKFRLGELLVEEGLITEQQHDQAIMQHKLTGEKIGYTFVSLGFVTEDQVLAVIAKQLNIPYIDLNRRKLDINAIHLLKEGQSKRFKALVIENNGHELLVAMADPADLQTRDHLERILSPLKINIALVKESQLNNVLQKYYRKSGDIEAFADILVEEYGADGFDNELEIDTELANQSTVVLLLNSIFEDAIRMRASDIHIEPEKKVLRIRQRIDGDLQENILNQVNIAAALVLRLKLMAGLNISEKRLPQDGRFNIKINQVELDVRISTMPIKYGESVVMRLLQHGVMNMGLEYSGMPPEMLLRTMTQLKQKQGMVLITGPTGSGKTTTLYGMLSELNTVKKKVITVEDPIEYELSRVNQVQVNHKIGLDFAKVLRTTLRQDPDIIMVGEMRDYETAEIGLRSALTGHLVLSTLHTNDAISTALRLIDMGAEGYLVASALKMVIAQRLVKKICVNCAVDYSPDTSETAWLRSFGVIEPQFSILKKGIGCSSCNDTGYSGRIGVFELLEIDEDMMRALRQNDPDEFTAVARKSNNFIPMAKSALQYLSQGVTSIEEIMPLLNTSKAAAIAPKQLSPVA